MTVIMIINFYRENKEAKVYAKNCANIKAGITLEEAKRIMGDINQNKRIRSEIWTHFTKDSIKEYYLTYPAVFGSSSSPDIYFDPKTQIVTRVVCGE